MIHRLRLVLRCAYAEPAEQAAHVLHLLPRALPRQRVRAGVLRADPPAPVREGTDHFGNPVAWLSIDRPHAGFELVSEAVVESAAPAAPDPFATPAWETVARAGALAPEAAEFTFGSPLAPAGGAARAYAAPSFPPGFPVSAGLLDLLGRIGRDVRLRPDAADPAGAERLLELRAGGYQDFAHLMVAGLRGLGLPARYVSGCVRRGGVGRLHAWVECWLGPRHGWFGLDPAQDCAAAEGHVLLGWGRDHADVEPVRGVRLGGGAHDLRACVEMESGAGAGPPLHPSDTARRPGDAGPQRE